MINNIFNYKRDLIINSINKISDILEQRNKIKKKYQNNKFYKEKKYIFIYIIIYIFKCFFIYNFNKKIL